MQGSFYLFLEHQVQVLISLWWALYGAQIDLYTFTRTATVLCILHTYSLLIGRLSFCYKLLFCMSAVALDP